MDRYKYFENPYEYRSYISSLNLFKIGEGSEGEAFLDNKNQVVKIFKGRLRPKVKEEDKETIVMAEDYNVSSYLLPKQLYILDNIIVGYVSDYFPGNVLLFGAPYNSNIKDINIDNLLKAREKLIKDTKKLSKNHIVIYDLAFNLLFDNNKFGAIDTFGYYKNSYANVEDNIASVDYAILRELHFHDLNFEPNYDESVEYNLKRIRK